MTRSTFGLAVAVALAAIGTGGRAQEAPRAARNQGRVTSGDEAVAALEREFEDAQAAARTNPSQASADPSAFAERFFALADRSPTGAAALDSYVWILLHDDVAADREKAWARLLTGFGASPELAAVVQKVGRAAPSRASEEFLRGVVDKSSDRDVLGWATWTLGNLLLTWDEFAAFLADPALPAATRAAFVGDRGQELVDQLLARDRAKLRREAVALLERVAGEFYLVPHARAGYLGALAEPLVYELNHLQIGMVAPEIEGADEDGVPFKLSDYRGKVVGLDFWGFWCPLCRAGFDEERALVARLKDAPFALVGVNSDPKARLETDRKYEKVPWRSFFDGGDAYGPIARQWNVTTWPILYVLDEEGVIRLKTESHAEMAAKVDELLAAQKTAGGAGAGSRSGG